MTYDNNMKGTLGANKRKTTDAHPSHTGQCVIDGVGYWVSAWVKENGSTGERFFSLAFKPKEDSLDRSAQQKLAAAKAGGPSVDDFDDDIPF